MVAQTAQRTRGWGHRRRKAAAGFEATMFIWGGGVQKLWLALSFIWKISTQTLSWTYPNQEVGPKVDLAGYCGDKNAGI